MNLFTAAKQEAPKAAPKAKGKEKVEKQINGLAIFAQIQVAISSLEALAKDYETNIKDQMHNFFVVQGEGAGRRPESFRGIDGAASASCEMRKRSSRSVLTDEEVQMLEDNKIPFDVEVDQKEQYFINPAYAGNSELLAKVSEALQNVPGLPADFIQHQAEKSRRVASDASLEAIFKTKTADALLPVVATLALKPTTEDANLTDALKTIQDLIAKKS